MVRKDPPPEPERKSRRGRPRAYPLAEMATVCILMNHSNLSYRKAENAAASWNLDLNGLVPDHTTILRAHAELDMRWLERMVAATANECLEKARMTPSSVADTDMLPPLLEQAEEMGRSLAGWWLHADRGYDSDRNCRAALDAGMRPNIDQRKSGRNSGNRRSVGKRFRRRAAALFDRARYGKRMMVEGIFGTEETRARRLLCGYRKKETQERFGMLLAITWNVRALNRIRCAAETAAGPAAG